MSRLSPTIPASWRRAPGGYAVGEGERPWVLIPGIRGDPAEFARLVPLLDGPVRILATATLGGPGGEPDTLAEYAWRALDVLPPGPLRVIGASFGGLVGMAMPPSRVASLVTIGSLPTRTAASRRAGALGRLVPLLPRPLYARLYGRRTADALAEDGPDIGALAVPPRECLAARLRAIGRWNLPDPAGRGVRCVWGQDDAWVTWTEAEVRALGLEPRIVPGGHFPHLSAPEAVRAALEG